MERAAGAPAPRPGPRPRRDPLPGRERGRARPARCRLHAGVGRRDGRGGASSRPRAGERHDDETGQAALVRELLERTIAASGVPATVRIDEGEELVATLVGPDLGVLIGRHGQTIDALQYLANAIGHRTQGEDRLRVVVDAAGYRARRAATLETVARRAAEQAAATGHRVELEPMTAVERRIVHELLKDDPEVETSSEGIEPTRFVVVLPRRSAD